MEQEIQELKAKIKFLDEQNITFGIQNTELRREIAGLKAELYTERLKPDTSSLGETINDILNYVPPPERLPTEQLYPLIQQSTPLAMDGNSKIFLTDEELSIGAINFVKKDK